MRTSLFKYLVIIISSISLAFIMACEGPEGPTGPAGPQGSQGEAGQQGPEGPAGTANVIYSDWMALSDLEAASDTTVVSRNYRKYDVPASDLTQEIIDMGSILVYFRLNGTILQLPATFGGANPIYITFSPFQPGVLSILTQSLDNTSIAVNTAIEIRYIFIPGGVSASKAIHSDLSDYYAVMEFYGIDP